MKKRYSFEVEFGGPVIENILALKNKLSKEEYEEIQDNFFETIHDEENGIGSSICDDKYYSCYTFETENKNQALKQLKEKLKPLNKTGLKPKNIKELDLERYDL